MSTPDPTQLVLTSDTTALELSAEMLEAQLRELDGRIVPPLPLEVALAMVGREDGR